MLVRWLNYDCNCKRKKPSATRHETNKTAASFLIRPFRSCKVGDNWIYDFSLVSFFSENLFAAREKLIFMRRQRWRWMGRGKAVSASEMSVWTWRHWRKNQRAHFPPSLSSRDRNRKLVESDLMQSASCDTFSVPCRLRQCWPSGCATVCVC